MTWAIIFQIAASCSAIGSMWIMGNRSAWGPAVGLFSQTLWCGVIVTSELWGLVPLTLAMTFVHARNLYLWWPRYNPVPEVF